MHLAFIGDLVFVAPAWLTQVCSEWDAFAQSAASTLVSSIWQGAVIVCGLEIALRLMPRISAAHRFAVWAGGLAVAAGLPLLPLMHWGASSGGAGGAVSREPARALLQLDARWGLAIAGLWVAASVIRGADLAVHSIRLRRLWKAARPVEVNEKLATTLENVRGGQVTICTTEILDRPSVIGFLAPRILIPAWLMGRLTAGELEQIVLHEAEHLRRRDDWTNLVQKLALVVFPLNPALAWMEHRLCREREMACDEGVVRITNAPRAYAACLASLAERGLERRAEALSLGAWHKRSELIHRVHGILLRKRTMSRTAAAALLGVVGCALVGATLEMARCPQLVAFVPEQKSLAMTPARQQELAAMLAREDAASKMTLPHGYHAVQAKAVMPEAHVAERGARIKTTAARMKAAPAGQEQIAQADGGGDRVNRGEQQWIVLAAWEEVQTVSRVSAPVADYDTGATTGDAVTPLEAQKSGSAPGENSKNAGEATGKASNQANNRYTVTRLILRVVPANSASDSTQPATTVRGGWFVIQL
jgi:hypothetical protein